MSPSQLAARKAMTQHCMISSSDEQIELCKRRICLQAPPHPCRSCVSTPRNLRGCCRVDALRKFNPRRSRYCVRRACICSVMDPAIWLRRILGNAKSQDRHVGKTDTSSPFVSHRLGCVGDVTQTRRRRAMACSTSSQDLIVEVMSDRGVANPHACVDSFERP